MGVPINRLDQTSLELLEPHDGKLSCTVLRGESPRKGTDLLNNHQAINIDDHLKFPKYRYVFF